VVDTVIDDQQLGDDKNTVDAEIPIDSALILSLLQELYNAILAFRR
jgi:hypothetical protein